MKERKRERERERVRVYEERERGEAREDASAARFFSGLVIFMNDLLFVDSFLRLGSSRQ